MENVKLSNVTLVCIDCLNYYSAQKAIEKSIENIDFGEVLFITDIEVFNPKYRSVIIPKIVSKELYSQFMFNVLVDYIETDFCLVIQYDGYVINPNLWSDEFLKYDYIGAAWWYDNNNVGNGGFSLRSRKLLQTLSAFEPKHPEDDAICRLYRKDLEILFIKFAPESLAEKFSYEPNGKYPEFKNDTFGFHGIPKLIIK